MTKYMVVETHREGCLDEVYRRFHKKGRMIPEGLHYIDSWLEKDGDRCFSVDGNKKAHSRGFGFFGKRRQGVRIEELLLRCKFGGAFRRWCCEQVKGTVGCSNQSAIPSKFTPTKGGS